MGVDRADGAPGAALVTGANRGIGRAVALELAARGFEVWAGVRDPASAAGLPEEAGARVAARAATDDGIGGGSIRIVALDVTRPETIAVPDGLRILVNNAGVDTVNQPVEHTTTEEWWQLLGTNVVGLVEVTRQALPVLRADGGGVIVNVTSAGLLVPMPFFSVYRASKAAVTALTESLRAEVAPFGIRVVEVLPGPVGTDMLAASAELPEAAEHEAYRPLAELVAQLRAGTIESATPVEVAARLIVDRALDPDGPVRVGCDPLGDALLAAFETTPEPEHLAAYAAAFRL